MALSNMYVCDMLAQDYESFSVVENKKNLSIVENKKNQLSSPQSIVSEIDMQPVAMNPLPETFMSQPLLPPTATWGLRHKIEMRRRNRYAVLEEIDVEYCADTLQNKWFLSSKIHHLGSKAERNDKAKQRNLLKKHYVKQRSVKSKAREFHEAFLAKAKDQANADEMNEANEMNVEGELVANKSTKKAARRSVLQDKVRRNLRRDARDRMCFAADDAYEAEAIGLAAKLFKRPKKVNPFTTPSFIKMLKSPSGGVPLSDIFLSRGVFLSFSAAEDLQTMMSESRQASVLMPLLIQKSTISPKAHRYLQANPKKNQKASAARGSSAYMRTPSMVKAQGKRRS